MILREELSSPQAGAVATFEGRVRNSNNRKEVSLLEYQTEPQICQREARKIIKQIKEHFKLLSIRAAQRIGRLDVNEISVWIGVASVHRKEAFAALEELIRAFKEHLPIWKKEYYADGTQEWLAGHRLNDYFFLSPNSTIPSPVDEQDFYARQKGMFQLPSDSQCQLKGSKVLVVGAGGLGSAVLTSLAQIGVGTIGLCEGDTLELSNLHRQSLYTSGDVGRAKALLARQRLLSLNPFVNVVLHPQHLSEINLESIITGYDLILDCTDNFPAKFLINDGCVHFQKPLIQASIYQLQGEIRSYYPDMRSACLRCQWPTIPQTQAVRGAPFSWVISMTPAIMGHFQALEAVKYLLALPDQLNGRVLLVDLQSYTFTHLKSYPSPSCRVCGVKVTSLP